MTHPQNPWAELVGLLALVGPIELTPDEIYSACERVSKTLPVRHILKTSVVTGHAREDGLIAGTVDKADVYLSRHYIYPRVDPMHRRDLPPPPWAIHLHHFNRSDADFELHNHPWEWGLSLILTGGYREERKVECPDGSFTVETNTYLPGAVNLIRHNDFHRVELLDEVKGCWTLFLTGQRVQDWGFWDRNTQKFTQWEAFIQAKHPPAVFVDRTDE